MLTQFFRSINWVDVALAVLFVRTVFVSVKSGFVAESFRFFGTLTALFVSLHWYSFLAQFLVKKTKMSAGSLDLIVFITLWLVIVLIFMLLYRGVLLLFKIEANHQVIDRYAAGFMGATRGVFLTSLTIFALLLCRQPFVQNQTFKSFGYALTAKAAPNTYYLGYHALIGKIFAGQQFNEEVFAVIGRHGINPK